MATVDTAKPSLTESRAGALRIAIPYALTILAQVPLLLIYFSDLWKRPHYQFFPFALLVVGVFAWIRWPRQSRSPFFASSFSSVLFWIGVGLAVMGTAFVTAWFSAASFVVLLASLFARTRDGEYPNRSLVSLSLPLFVILALPANLDFWLINNLQRFSAGLSSLYLDLFGYLHYSPGTTLNFPDEIYEVERACSGVQSFFTLLFCATVIIIVLRRGWFRGLVLMVSAVAWAILMNSVRIVTIPVAKTSFGLDLKDGLPHEILGYGVMLFACLMLLSADQLMEYLFGSRTAGPGERGVRGFWGRRRSDDEHEREFAPVSAVFRGALMATAVIMVGVGLFQASDVARSLANPEFRVRFFDASAVIDVDGDIMPEVLESKGGEYRWNLANHERTDRKRGSDLGQRSDTWTYYSPAAIFANISLDQPFPGWHELTTCYRNTGWKFESLRRKLSAPFTTEDGEQLEWTYIEVELFSPATMQRGILLFCFCDSSGAPFDAPLEWDEIRSLYERVKNRLSYRIRANLFRGQAYQMQLFSTFTKTITEEDKEELRSQFFEARRLMREGLLKYRDSDSAGAGNETRTTTETLPPADPQDQGRG